MFGCLKKYCLLSCARYLNVSILHLMKTYKYAALEVETDFLISGINLTRNLIKELEFVIVFRPRTMVTNSHLPIYFVDEY